MKKSEKVQRVADGRPDALRFAPLPALFPSIPYTSRVFESPRHGVPGGAGNTTRLFRSALRCIDGSLKVYRLRVRAQRLMVAHEPPHIRALTATAPGDGGWMHHRTIARVELCRWRCIRRWRMHIMVPVELCRRQWVRRWLMRHHHITRIRSESSSVDSLGFDGGTLVEIFQVAVLFLHLCFIPSLYASVQKEFF